MSVFNNFEKRIKRANFIKNCHYKTQYSDEGYAERAKVDKEYKYKVKMEVYKCNYCKQYHLSRVK